MSFAKGTLHLVCGKIASGKSTLIAELGAAPGTVVFSEDAWLSKLYGEDMTSVADYVRYTARLREAMGPHVVTLLKAGLSVALDFPANTGERRAWMRSLFEQAGAGGTGFIILRCRTRFASSASAHGTPAACMSLR